MAREIRETPILKGKDAQRFDKIIKDNEKRKATADEIQRAKQAYDTFGFDK